MFKSFSFTPKLRKPYTIQESALGMHRPRTLCRNESPPNHPPSQPMPSPTILLFFRGRSILHPFIQYTTKSPRLLTEEEKGRMTRPYEALTLQSRNLSPAPILPFEFARELPQAHSSINQSSSMGFFSLPSGLGGLMTTFPTSSLPSSASSIIGVSGTSSPSASQP